MDINFLAGDRRKKEEQERQKMSQRPRLVEMTEPEKVPIIAQTKELPKVKPEEIPLEDATLPLVKQQLEIVHAVKKVDSPDNSNETPAQEPAGHPIRLVAPAVPRFHTLRHWLKSLRAPALPVIKKPAPEKPSSKVSTSASLPAQKPIHTNGSSRATLVRKHSSVTASWIIWLIFFLTSFVTALFFGWQYQQGIREFSFAEVQVPHISDEQIARETRLARDTKRLNDIDLIAQGLAKFYARAGHYPVTPEIVLGTSSTNCLHAFGWVARDRCQVPGSPAANIIDLFVVPADPGDEFYRYRSDGATYQLLVTFEEGVAQYIAGENIVDKP